MNGNDYQRGWQDGRLDAMASRDKNYNRMGQSWKMAIYGSSSLDTYIQGYDEGYSVGLRERDVKQKVEITNLDDNMCDSNNSSQNYLRELQAIEQLNNLLVSQVCDRLMMVNSRMKAFILKMSDTGVAVQTCEQYRAKYYSVDAQHFQNIYNRIVSADLPQIRKYYEMVASQLELATGQRVSVNLRLPSASAGSDFPREAISRNGDISDLLIQAEATAAFMSYLVNERDEMNQTLQDYEDRCNGMIAAGVPKQICSHYVSNFVPVNVHYIRNSVAHLQSEDYPYLDGVFRKTTQDIQILGGSVNISPKSM